MLLKSAVDMEIFKRPWNPSFLKNESKDIDWDVLIEIMLSVFYGEQYTCLDHGLVPETYCKTSKF